MDQNEKTTKKEYQTSKNQPLINQVLAQPKAVQATQRAAKAKRNVLLIGLPGTGKSMLGKALSELLESNETVDIIAQYNSEEPNRPIIVEKPPDQSEGFLQKEREEYRSRLKLYKMITILGLFFVFSLLLASYMLTNVISLIEILFGLLVIMTWIMYRSRNSIKLEQFTSAILVKQQKDEAPFIDATGATKSMLLGDIKHDPYQTGGLETPEHQRIIPGLIHKAHKGVLYIDEIGTLDFETQISLLTAMEDKQYPIEGRGEGSSGTAVKTDPVPCDFMLVAAGNYETVNQLHPALRNRIQGYGMEVLLESHAKLNDDTVNHIEQFVGQELANEGLNIDYDPSSITSLGRLAEIKAKKDGYISLQFRYLGGILRAAVDSLSNQDKNKLDGDNIQSSREYQLTVEEQQRLKKLKNYIESKNLEEDTLAAWYLIEEDNPLFEKIKVLKSSVNNDLIEVNENIVKRITQKQDNLRYYFNKNDQNTFTENKISAALISIIVADTHNCIIPDDTVISGYYNFQLNPLPEESLTSKIDWAAKVGFRRIICVSSIDRRYFKYQLDDIEIHVVNSLNKLITLLKSFA